MQTKKELKRRRDLMKAMLELKSQNQPIQGLRRANRRPYVGRSIKLDEYH